jgi:hypothetical protein
LALVMSELSLKTKLRVADDVVFREVEGEAVILSIGSGLFFGLTPVATRIWELLGAGQALDEILTTLAAEYDAPQAVLERDLRELASQLVAKRLAVPAVAAT